MEFAFWKCPYHTTMQHVLGEHVYTNSKLVTNSLKFQSLYTLKLQHKLIKYKNSLNTNPNH